MSIILGASVLSVFVCVQKTYTYSYAQKYMQW